MHPLKPKNLKKQTIRHASARQQPDRTKANELGGIVRSLTSFHMSFIDSRPFGHPRQVDNMSGSNPFRPRQASSGARGNIDFLFSQYQTELIDQVD